MSTWVPTTVRPPGSGGTAALIPEGGGPRSPSDQWLVLGTADSSDLRDRPNAGWAHPTPDPRVEDPRSDPTPARQGLNLLRRDEAGVAICDVLAAWRAAERELAGLAAGDGRGAPLEAEIRGLRDLHHRLFAARSRSAADSIGDRLASWSADVGEWLSPSARQMTT